MLLNREQIDKARDIRYEDVAVPEWGGDVRVRGLTGAERDAYEGSMIRQSRKSGRVEETPDRANFRARLLVRCIVDEDNHVLYSDEDVRTLAQKSAVALERLFSVACRLSGITAADADALEGNFDAGPAGDSPSD